MPRGLRNAGRAIFIFPMQYFLHPIRLAWSASYNHRELGNLEWAVRGRNEERDVTCRT
jgi:hypothetical protein